MSKSKKGIPSNATGKHWTLDKETREQYKFRALQISKKGVEHYRWKGADIGYRALHKWVEYQLGKPSRCEHCKTDGLKGRSINWANVSKQYKRDLKDWRRLCVPCHRKFDSKKIINKQ